MKKIVVVCLGNICRSPMLQVMLRDYFASKKAQIDVDSAGFLMHIREMSRFSREVLCDNGHMVGEHTSKFLSAGIFHSSDLILTMTDQQARDIDARYGVSGKVVAMSTFLGHDVFDPYNMGKEAYETIYEQFVSCLDKIYQYCKMNDLL